MTSQPVRNNIVQPKKKRKKVKVKPTKREVIRNAVERSKKKHPEYGTSKLEEKFAKEFLDKLGVEYQYQYYASDIKRYYDFKIKNGPIIEVNGSYWHGDKRIYEEKDLNGIQKRAIYVDNLKKKWALIHGIPIYYIWEKDINENPEGVMKFLKQILLLNEYKNTIKNDKKKRH